MLDSSRSQEQTLEDQANEGAAAVDFEQDRQPPRMNVVTIVGQRSPNHGAGGDLSMQWAISFCDMLCVRASQNAARVRSRRLVSNVVVERAWAAIGELVRSHPNPNAAVQQSAWRVDPYSRMILNARTTSTPATVRGDWGEQVGKQDTSEGIHNSIRRTKAHLNSGEHRHETLHAATGHS
ncbi:uncharacterized protein EV420DRAFT_1578687 [Desarmillaria tabescens]|uniref:Uncharacterized protein n=1 Tax=Armillaria tabescens TaxID=1929756 RepID=A0AA39MQ84_ARMTA|nr:uncharacterized protein EV420DRAFT_1578687 [Desarmillaria tabescens]KAK0442263.1 hypothetical protein EV420DRAFT_1578687 [Desarmillaria tabescens]